MFQELHGQNSLGITEQTGVTTNCPLGLPRQYQYDESHVLVNGPCYFELRMIASLQIHYDSDSFKNRKIIFFYGSRFTNPDLGNAQTSPS